MHGGTGHMLAAEAVPVQAMAKFHCAAIHSKLSVLIMLTCKSAYFSTI